MKDIWKSVWNSVILFTYFFTHFHYQEYACENLVKKHVKNVLFSHVLHIFLASFTCISHLYFTRENLHSETCLKRVWIRSEWDMMSHLNYSHWFAIRFHLLLCTRFHLYFTLMQILSEWLYNSTCFARKFNSKSSMSGQTIVTATSHTLHLYFTWTFSANAIYKLKRETLYRSRKYPYFPHRRDWNFLGVGGFCKAKKFKEMYET